MQENSTPPDTFSQAFTRPGVSGPLDGMVTLIEGSTFCISGRSGDVVPGSVQGLFYRDTRILAGWQVRVQGTVPQVVMVLHGEPYQARFVSRVPVGDRQAELLIERTRYVGDGMREEIRVRNLGPRPVRTTLQVRCSADFADLFAVKEGRGAVGGRLSIRPHASWLDLQYERNGVRRGVRIAAGPAVAFREGLHFEVSVPARGEWRTSVMVSASVQGLAAPEAFGLGLSPADSPPAVRMRTWREGSPKVETVTDELRPILARSLEDLGALRIVDPQDPSVSAVAAGAPWFMALFGRDSLLSAYMAMPLDTSLTVGTLRALARLQGRVVNPQTEEQPGRILHETRLGMAFPLIRGGGSVYYGTADATALFVVLLGELNRWGFAPQEVERLLPHADRALAWIEEYGDRDGDGFVEYQRMTENGLVNQGWKDSHDGINGDDGHPARPPIALAEVQGYVYAAYLARAHLAVQAGDSALRDRMLTRAAQLKEAFNERFWLPERGWFAVGLDADKQPIDALASNQGHCLWTGLIDEDKAGAVVERLMSPEMFTGWGVRTLASTTAAYNPMSYHNGSVWPHDNALIATGLIRYGYVREGQRLATALLEAAGAFGGRLPELFCGFDRSDYPAPVPYPTSCSPQAWASAAPIQLMKALLRLDPCMSRREVWFAPVWPEAYGPLRMHNIPLGPNRITLTVDDAGAQLSGVAPDVRVVTEPRAPLTALTRARPEEPVD
jgi:glycogen debranching enzyme